MLTADAVLEERKTHPPQKKDILSTMIEGRDKETGLGMSEDNIKNNVRRKIHAFSITDLCAQLLTFLIAGK